MGGGGGLCLGLFNIYIKFNYIKFKEYNITFNDALRLFEGVIFTSTALFILAFFEADKINALKFIALYILILFALLFTSRICFHFYLFNLKPFKQVLIVGGGKRAEDIINVIKNKRALKMNIIGVADDTTSKNIQKADVVVLTRKSAVKGLIPKDKTVYLMSELYEVITEKFYTDKESLEDFPYIIREKYNNSLYEILKRRFDIIAAIIILTVTFPVVLIIALGVKLTDGKNPFYTQDRLGKGGKIFKAYKIRTMYENNFKVSDNKKVGYVENQDEDDRVIPFCKLVRKARLDEILQMINVLKGEMSVVGPRAEWTQVGEVYKKEVEGYELRMLVDTAWTGWAQINQGSCFALDNEKVKLQYDLYYIKHRNLFFDIAILIKAVFLALGGRHG